MENAGIVLVISTAIVGLASIISASYKTGFIAFSVQSHLRDDQPKYEVDNNKTGRFAKIMLATFLLNILYGFLIVQDLREIAAVIVFSLLNTAFIAYSLVYWVLLKKKVNQKARKR
ncbi:MAG TPA: hypothetical protein VK694_07655 [Verrucomicrobiae bacterium]|nr:hypothetical protein [Verrucomicrobiae bacterium]